MATTNLAELTVLWYLKDLWKKAKYGILNDKNDNLYEIEFFDKNNVVFARMILKKVGTFIEIEIHKLNNDKYSIARFKIQLKRDLTLYDYLTNMIKSKNI